MKRKADTSQRRKHTNSRLGCANCKRKKVRCDENLPQCRNCEKGKNEVCSYLKLDQQEVTRINLAHNLRDDHNKMLDQEFRLPTSRSVSRAMSKSPMTDFNGLNFEFEMTHLPLRIPDVIYPPLHYNHTGIEDFSDEFEVIKDDTPRPQSRRERPISQTRPLPGAKQISTSFDKINHVVVDTFEYDVNEYGMIQRDTLFRPLGRLLVQDLPAEARFIYDVIVCLGQVIMWNQIRASINYTWDKDTVCKMEAWLKNNSFSLHTKCVSSIVNTLTQFNHMSYREQSKEHDDYMNLMMPLIYYGNNFLSYSGLMLGFTMTNYTKVNAISLNVVNQYLRYNKTGKHPDLIRYIINTVHYNSLSITIPSYDPACIEEISDNLGLLSPTFVSTFNFTKKSMSILYAEVRHQYKQLKAFLDEEVGPILKEQQRNKAITYDADKIYILLQKWLINFPSRAVPYNPKRHLKVSAEVNYIYDLFTILYSYYFAIGCTLMSNIPEVTYLFGLNFSLKGVNFFIRPEVIKSEANPLQAMFFSHQVSDYFLRHNYYALRIYSFFRHRLRIFYGNVRWKPNKYSFSLNDRSFKPVSEKPIQSFNYTLIRPENYPTTPSYVSESTLDSGISFFRKDEAVLLKLYTRNIETLDFFTKDYVLQFDFESQRLLRDYRPVQRECKLDYDRLSKEDVENYIDDRKVLIEGREVSGKE